MAFTYSTSEPPLSYMNITLTPRPPSSLFELVSTDQKHHHTDFSYFLRRLAFALILVLLWVTGLSRLTISCVWYNLTHHSCIPTPKSTLTLYLSWRFQRTTSMRLFYFTSFCPRINTETTANCVDEGSLQVVHRTKNFYKPHCIP